jgi:hypothetical protein
MQRPDFAIQAKKTNYLALVHGSVRHLAYKKRLWGWIN